MEDSVMNKANQIESLFSENRHNSINLTVFQKTCEWIYETVREARRLTLSFKLLNDILVRRVVIPNRVQLIGAVCLSIADKQIDNELFTAPELVEFANNAFTLQEFCNTRSQVVNLFEGKIHPLTAIDVLRGIHFDNRVITRVNERSS